MVMTEVQRIHPNGMTAHPSGPRAAPKKCRVPGLWCSAVGGAQLQHWAHFTHPKPQFVVPAQRTPSPALSWTQSV